MTTYYLIRHGTRVNRTENTSLSQLGILQAQATAEYLKNLSVDSIFASPLLRTQQTAEIISKVLNLPIITDDRLKERMVFDDTHSLAWNDFLKEWDKTTIDRSYVPIYGDSAIDSGNRLKSILDENSDHKTYALIAHGGVIGDLLRNLFEDDLLPFGGHEQSILRWVEIHECSITEIHKEGYKYSLKRVCDIDHLSSCQ